MRLYHFTKTQFGLDAIRDSRLKIARINELNDPFEFLGLALRRSDRTIMKKWKNVMDSFYGLICMSRDWQHPLLWGHYADGHRGMCLGFDVPGNGMFRAVCDHTGSYPAALKKLRHSSGW